jgi:4'-phosphopantetheinyl transferase EntD
MITDWPFIAYVAEGALLIVDLIDRCQAPFLGAEAELAENVTNARIRELMAGRSTARRALRLIGVEPKPILSRSDGAPVWPLGLCGSISHSHRHIAVLLARSSHYESVGIDIDDGRPLGVAASANVATAQELEVVDRAGWTVSGATAENLAFSAKEAIFKCQFPVTLDASLDFLDVCLELGESVGNVKIRVIDSERPALTQVADRFHVQALSAFDVTVVYAYLGR